MILGYYHDTYVKTDVWKLADVFKTFWNTCLKYCKLDSAHFYVAPGLARQVLLKIASANCLHDRLAAQHEQVKRKDCELCPDKFRLELLRDTGMLLLFEKGFWGGITQTVKCYAKSSNKYLKDHYNPYMKSTYFQYLDTSNLYLRAVMQKVRTYGFALANILICLRKKNLIFKLTRYEKINFINIH